MPQKVVVYIFLVLEYSWTVMYSAPPRMMSIVAEAGFCYIINPRQRGTVPKR